MVEPAYASLTVEHLKVLTSKVHPYQRIMGVDPVGSEKSAGSGSSRLYLTLFDRESVNAYIIYVIMP
jgi:hypothetical protein